MTFSVGPGSGNGGVGKELERRPRPPVDRQAGFDFPSFVASLLVLCACVADDHGHYDRLTSFSSLVLHGLKFKPFSTMKRRSGLGKTNSKSRSVFCAGVHNIFSLLL